MDDAWGTEKVQMVQEKQLLQWNHQPQQQQQQQQDHQQEQQQKEQCWLQGAAASSTGISTSPCYLPKGEVNRLSGYKGSTSEFTTYLIFWFQ